jgi:hypothetical protein
MSEQHVFISYSRRDQEFALRVVEHLRDEGMDVWIDSTSIRPGDVYGEEITRGIRGARAFVLIFSEASNASREVHKEVQLAANYQIPIIPLRLSETPYHAALEYHLAGAQWIDIERGSAAGLGSLVAHLGGKGTPRPSAPIGAGARKARSPAPPRWRSTIMGVAGVLGAFGWWISTLEPSDPEPSAAGMSTQSPEAAFDPGPGPGPAPERDRTPEPPAQVASTAPSVPAPETPVAPLVSVGPVVAAPAPVCADLVRTLQTALMGPSDWAAFALECPNSGLPVSWVGTVRPSFNCARASSQAERKVCSDELLSVLDQALGSVYAGLRATAPDRAALQAMQTRWLRDVRDACGGLECMARVYAERILELGRFSDPTEGERPE